MKTVISITFSAFMFFSLSAFAQNNNEQAFKRLIKECLESKTGAKATSYEFNDLLNQYVEVLCKKEVLTDNDLNCLYKSDGKVSNLMYFLASYPDPKPRHFWFLKLDNLINSNAENSKIAWTYYNRELSESRHEFERRKDAQEMITEFSKMLKSKK